MQPPRIAVLSSLISVLEESRRLAAGVGVEIDVLDSVLAGGARPCLLIVGEDVDEPPEPPGVPRVLVALDAAERADSIWRRAAALGVEHVALLPGAEEWLIQRMIAAVEPPQQPAPTIGVVAGSGGAGSSLLACAAARHAAAQGRRTLLIDADPLGGGVDLVLGMESHDGLRWPALVNSRGRLRPSTLVDALPRDDLLSVLSWDRSGTPDVGDDVFDAVVSAAQLAFDTVILDLPRHAPRGWTRRCRHVLLIVPTQVRAAVAAAQVARRLTSLHPDVRLVVRRTPGGVHPGALADSLGLPFAGELKTDRGLADTIDRGEGLPHGNRGITRAAGELLGALG
ncbi:septum site-determining protein Ssd [Sediminivirga luteola]|nr:septum site-determining protein Ssd [Sediminivirga luteola]MCI2266123.1 hypothetical protein [Sediminivirga luteola]